MLDIALTLGYCAFGLSLLIALSRLLRGPEMVDRLLSLDTLYVNALGLLVLAGIGRAAGEARSALFEVALLIALVGFVSTVAGARFLSRGDVIE